MKDSLEEEILAGKIGWREGAKRCCEAGIALTWQMNLPESFLNKKHVDVYIDLLVALQFYRNVSGVTN